MFFCTNDKNFKNKQSKVFTCQIKCYNVNIFFIEATVIVV